MQFLDNVIDANSYPIPEIEEIFLSNRKIGLGIMGFADMLVLLGIGYDSDKAVQVAAQVSQFLTETAHSASQKLAESRGAFPNWEGSIWHTKYNLLMRNATCTTIAPTGSISIIAGCSSGIEPIFSLATERLVLEGRKFIELHPLLEQLGNRDGWMNDRIRAGLLEGVPPKEIPGFPEALAEMLVTAHEVAPEWHVRLQAAFQSNIDNAVSKTVNLPANATVDDVSRVFSMGYELGCKGMTVYRDGSRQRQTLTTASNRNTSPEAHGLMPRQRTRVTQGQTSKFRMGCGTLFVTVNRDESGLCEVFANLGKAGGCPAQSEATCRAVSAALRAGLDPQSLIEQLKGIRCPSTLIARKDNKSVDVLSCPDAVARALEEAVSDADALERPVTPVGGKTCPLCHQPMRREAGCFRCDTCLFSSCG